MKKILFFMALVLTQTTMAFENSFENKIICTVTDDATTQLSKAKSAYEVNDWVRLASSSSKLDSDVKMQRFINNLNAFCQYPNSDTCYHKNNYKPANCKEISVSLINPGNQFPVLKTIF